MTADAAARGPTASPRPGVARAFFQGLTTHSLATALGAIGFAVLELVLATVFVTPRTLAHLDPGYLRDNRTDDLAAATVEALRLRSATGERRGVVYVGSSNARMALYDNGRGMSEELTRAAGEPIDFYNLAVNAQRMAEWVAVLDQVPRAFRGVVVLGVCDQIKRFSGPNMFERMAIGSHTLEHPPPGLREFLAADGVSPPRRLGVFWLDHLKFFASRRAVLTRTGPAPGRRADDVLSPRPRRWAKVRARVSRQPRPPLLGLLAQLRGIVASIRHRGLDVVILESPVNPRLDAIRPPGLSRVAVYEPAMLGFAVDTGARYWNPTPDAHLAANDFADEIHLANVEGQKRYERAFVARLADLLRGVPVEDGPRSPDAVAAADFDDDAAADDGEIDDDGEDADLELDPDDAPARR